MTMQPPITGNAVTRRLEPEPLTVYAYRELTAHTPWQRGICFNPGCGCGFEPRRDWQIYCSTGCERVGTAELRKWGHKMALSLLIWRMGKYPSDNSAQNDLTRVARRYVTHVQSAWLQDRAERAAGRVAT